MARRTAEKRFVARALGSRDPDFFAKNCNSCHLRGCLDCHEENSAFQARPDSRQCLACHQGYFIGPEYAGLAPREDSLRYQRGPELDGRHYLKMSPDLHYQAGLECGDCHSMASLARGEASSRSCRDCHQPSPEIIEHSIEAHRSKLECYACHSAWVAQEYGTFYLRFSNSTNQRFFPLRPWGGEEYVKSAQIKKQNLPPLGLNSQGLVSPIRPQFIAFYTHIRGDEPAGEENELLAATWRPVFPHTVRKGAPACDRCHDNPRRFLLDHPETAVYKPGKDGLALDSYWHRSGQAVADGAFISPQRFEDMQKKNKRFVRAYIKKWKQILNAVEPSSD